MNPYETYTLVESDDEDVVIRFCACGRSISDFTLSHERAQDLYHQLRHELNIK